MMNNEFEKLFFNKMFFGIIISTKQLDKIKFIKNRFFLKKLNYFY